MADSVRVPEPERVNTGDATAVLVGFWCPRGGGHLSDSACNSGSVPLYAPPDGAEDVRAWIDDWARGEAEHIIGMARMAEQAQDRRDPW